MRYIRKVFTKNEMNKSRKHVKLNKAEETKLQKAKTTEKTAIEEEERRIV